MIHHIERAIIDACPLCVTKSATVAWRRLSSPHRDALDDARPGRRTMLPIWLPRVRVVPWEGLVSAPSSRVHLALRLDGVFFPLPGFITVHFSLV